MRRDTAHIKFILNMPLWVLHGQGTKKLEEVTPQERRIFKERLELLYKYEEERNLLLIYRGESYARLKNQLFKDTTKYSESSLYEKIFKFGEKPNHCWLDSHSSIATRDFLTQEQDVRQSTFDYIYRQIKRILNKRIPEIREFTNDNPVFASYFSTESSEEFFQRIKEQPHEFKLLLRDYYLFFLHAIAEKANRENWTGNIKDKSLLISTSLALSVARNFSDGMIVFCFVPRPIAKYTVSSWINIERAKEIEKLGLPIYSSKSGLYPRQREVAMRGAIFPQYIIGVYDVISDRFIINHYLFELSKEQVKLLPIEGSVRDQSLLNQELQDTKISRSIWHNYDDDFFWEELIDNV